MATLPLLEDSYTDDPYIHGLATKATRCFGLKFEVKVQTCRTCPVAGSCQEKFYSKLGEAAVREMPPGEDIDALVNEAATNASESAPVQRFAAFADSICCVCHIKIEQGTEVNFHIRDGFWHDECNDGYLRGDHKKEEKSK